jgi:hypothetical protein
MEEHIQGNEKCLLSRIREKYEPIASRNWGRPRMRWNAEANQATRIKEMISLRTITDRVTV